MVGVEGETSMGGSSSGVCSGGAGGGVCPMSAKVETTAFLSPVTTCMTSAPMCCAFLSRLKLSTSSIVLGTFLLRDSCSLVWPLLSSTGGAGRAPTAPTWASLLFAWFSLSGMTTACSDCWRFCAASSWVCSLVLSLASMPAPLRSTGIALPTRYCATLLVPTAFSAAAAAAPASAGHLELLLLRLLLACELVHRGHGLRCRAFAELLLRGLDLGLRLVELVVADLLRQLHPLALGGAEHALAERPPHQHGAEARAGRRSASARARRARAIRRGLRFATGRRRQRGRGHDPPPPLPGGTSLTYLPARLGRPSCVHARATSPRTVLPELRLVLSFSGHRF